VWQLVGGQQQVRDGALTTLLAVPSNDPTLVMRSVPDPCVECASQYHAIMRDDVYKHMAAKGDKVPDKILTMIKER
jgi:hypothetical protein